MDTNMHDFPEKKADFSSAGHDEIAQNETRQSEPGAKTALRLRYEAEKQVIQQQIGSLETIRQQLGLSRRKICQLLLVDPSAWSRWTRSTQEAPPHIYRALHWYLLLQAQEPALNYRVWLAGIGQERRPDAVVQWQREVEKRQQHVEVLLQENLSQTKQIQELTRRFTQLQDNPRPHQWLSTALWVGLGVCLPSLVSWLYRLFAV